MKKRISAIVNELGVASAEEIASILKELSSEIKNKTLSLKIREMEKEKVIFKILPNENSYGIEGYVAGSDMDAKDEFEIKMLIVEQGLSQRDLLCVDWKSFSSRIIDAFLDDIKRLYEDLEKFYDEPKNVEMRYFDLSIRYHELYRFFFDRYNVDFLVPIENLLKDCRDRLNKKDI